MSLSVSKVLTPTNEAQPPAQYQQLLMLPQQLLRHLAVVKQQSAAEERFTKNGLQKTVHVVIKNSPFTVVVAQNPASALPLFDLTRIAFECALVYDTDDETAPLKVAK